LYGEPLSWINTSIPRVRGSDVSPELRWLAKAKAKFRVIVQEKIYLVEIYARVGLIFPGRGHGGVALR
jgi:hypothetical protein